MSDEPTPEEELRAIILGYDPRFFRRRGLYRLIPSSGRCKNCYAPFTGMGAVLVRLTDRIRAPSTRNPRFCEF